MSNKIDAYTATAPALPVRAVSAARDVTSGAARQPAARADAVQLTGEARLLQQVQNQARAHDGVDEARVESIRQALRDGSYQTDGAAIAAALTGVERGL